MKRIETQNQVYNLMNTLKNMFGDIENLKIDININGFDVNELIDIAKIEKDELKAEILQNENSGYFQIYESQLTTYLTTDDRII